MKTFKPLFFHLTICRAVLILAFITAVAYAQETPPRKEKDAPDKAKPESTRSPEAEREKQVRTERINNAQAEMKDRIELMDMEIKALINQGQKEEAARLQDERNRIKEKLISLQQGDKPKGQRPMEMREGGDMENRLRHAQEAADHLRAAGMFELADRTMQQAQMMKASMRPEMGRGGFQPRMDAERLEQLEMKVMRLGEMLEELMRAQKRQDRAPR